MSYHQKAVYLDAYVWERIDAVRNRFNLSSRQAAIRKLIDTALTMIDIPTVDMLDKIHTDMGCVPHRDTRDSYRAVAREAWDAVVNVLTTPDP